MASHVFPSIVYPPWPPFLFLDTNPLLLPSRNVITHRGWPGFSFIPFCMLFLVQNGLYSHLPTPATPPHAVSPCGALGFSGECISTEAVVCKCPGEQRDVLMRCCRGSVGRASHAGSGGWGRANRGTKASV